ncbi:hypothetical protein D3C84_667370 [compost metagenome]
MLELMAPSNPPCTSGSGCAGGVVAVVAVVAAAGSPGIAAASSVSLPRNSNDPIKIAVLSPIKSTPSVGCDCKELIEKCRASSHLAHKCIVENIRGDISTHAAPAPTLHAAVNRP